ncbi:hypothetical protein LTR05_008396 [Lithohypha guttulata]|uniref:Transcription factor domain-containing protein n=1 Tax=Lithohypha guttulata TaxID=1690604 RepID=A0AAN7PK40_9EURO|nr:hypothetical protein LTR05_008396 [Lithohypha guttulata]
MGKSFGLDSRKHAPQMLLVPGSWAEQEEIRRSWWAVLLLDRHMHLTFPGHALNTEDPHQDEVLPAEDTLFDQAEMCGNEPLHVASPTSLKAGPFARSCQAAYLMGKVVNVLNEFAQESGTRFTLAIQVYHTVTAFSKVVQAEFDACPESFATPMALTYSALIALCDPFCCTITNRGAHTVEETELQILCIRGLKTTSDDAARLALQLRSSMTTRHSAISPLIGHCLYMATVTFAWRVYEGEKSSSQAHDVLREALSSFNGRWAVGMEYLNALDRAKDLLYTSPAHQLIGGPPGLTS